MAALYKVDAEKGFKILMATYPNLVFINGLRFSGAQAFADRFKSTDVNLLFLDSIFQRLAKKFILTEDDIQNYFAAVPHEASIQNLDLETALVTELHSYINRFRRTPCVIVGNVGSVDVLLKIFDEKPFTYVYVYPEAPSFKALLVAAIETAVDTDTPKTTPFLQLASPKKSRDAKIDAYVKEMMALRKKIFKTHTEQIGHALVILEK
jgi:hypothetical protein